MTTTLGVVLGAVLMQGGKATNPVIWADVPDISIVRVGRSYYMSSTTMHMSPGLPIMKSEDLVHWRLASYAYTTLGDNDALNLQNGKNAYGKGSWASSLRHHKGIFYVSTFSSTTGKTYIFSTKNPEKTPWHQISFSPSLHDHSLVFEEDGSAFLAFGAGDIRLTELNPDLSGVKPGGFSQVIIPNASRVAGEAVGLPAEGTQIYKHDGRYYLFNITWPRGGMRTQLVHRADQLKGPYEGRILIQDQGVAQGSIIETPDGKWYAYAFQDHGAVGRIPYLVPMRWEDGWPVAGVNGKVPMELDLPGGKPTYSGIVSSDEFDGKELPLAWQWNHNPDPRLWSLSERPGFLRLRTGRVDSEITQARNTLTQRTFGPLSEATLLLDVRAMRDGDRAGLMALQNMYAYVGVKMEGGKKTLVMVSKRDQGPVEVATRPLEQDRVHLRMSCDFRERKDLVTFSTSLDGQEWTPLGEPHRLRYDLVHFMGCRFGIFNYATRQAGGHVDVDHFRIGPGG